MPSRIFKFKHFTVKHEDSVHKLGTDSMLLGSIIKPDTEPKNVLDIGTGCGVLALMMAQKFPNSEINAIELDESTANEAVYNFNNSPFNGRLNVFNADCTTFAYPNTYDLIVSNPPYFIDNSLSKDNDKNRVRHQQNLPSEKLLELISQVLTEKGEAWLIYPTYEMDLVLDNIKSHGLFAKEIISQVGVKGKIIRKIVSLVKYQFETVPSTLLVRDKNGYTNEYIELTKDFHGMPLR
jgi:tRNA1Val (adenine37-N6)-methyltransferase